jgi:hypothetical protein
MTKIIRIWISSLIALGTIGSSEAQESRPPECDISIPSPLCDGTPSEPVTKPAPIPFNVLDSHTRRAHVTKAPEMADLPPVEGVINVTVQRVEDPGLPDPPMPPLLPATSPDASLARDEVEKLQETAGKTYLIMLSATVYNHSRTLLRISPPGAIEGQVCAWSNVDFNHFSAFSNFTVTEPDGTVNDYGLFMGIGNEEALSPDVDQPQVPNLPDLSVIGPQFSVIEGAVEGDAVKILSQLHDLYRKEGAKLELAFHAREKAHAERKAYLLANPPVPEDVTIQVWKRDVPLSQSKPGGVR